MSSSLLQGRVDPSLASIPSSMPDVQSLFPRAGRSALGEASPQMPSFPPPSRSSGPPQPEASVYYSQTSCPRSCARYHGPRCPTKFSLFAKPSSLLCQFFHHSAGKIPRTSTCSAVTRSAVAQKASIGRKYRLLHSSRRLWLLRSPVQTDLHGIWLHGYR